VWTLSTEPLFEIGVTDGDPNYMFERVVGVLITGDGGVVVADGGSREVRWYGSDGVHRFSARGEGSGPGEIRWLQRMVSARGDTIAIADVGQARVTMFAPDGSFSGSHSLRRGAALVGKLDDGTWIYTEAVEDAAPERRLGPAVYPVQIVGLSSTGGVDTITRSRDCGDSTLFTSSKTWEMAHK
jgi:hypothetical protein